MKTFFYIIKLAALIAIACILISIGMKIMPYFMQGIKAVLALIQKLGTTIRSFC